MFDTLRCEIPLEHEDLDGVDTTELGFQTKNLDKTLACLQITKEGRLVEYKQVRTGSWPQTISYEPVDLKHDGPVFFYTGVGDPNEIDNRWVEFKADFKEGQLQEIQAVIVEKIRKQEATTIWEKDCDKNAGPQ